MADHQTRPNGSPVLPASAEVPGAGAARRLTPAAERALAEAEARRQARDHDAQTSPPERGGQEGPDPVRYGDWQKGGIVSDF